MASSLFTGVTSLCRSKTEEVLVSSLDGEGKVLGLYFSAHWCPPCRSFTPKLAEWYSRLTTGPLKDKFEIVFVSSDRDEDSFDSYFEEMPWLALPYSAREHKAALSRKYKVQGIPTLVLINAGDGNLITKDGRSTVSQDPNGEKFPWLPETFEQIMSSCSFIGKDGDKITWDKCKDKTIGIYFSAHWCQPCINFTPQLVKCYEKIKSDGKKFEIIFSSSDHTEEEFGEYFSTMPWYAIPYRHDASKKLSRMFEVEGIPTLVILEGSTGNVITESGRGMVNIDPNGEDFPWHPKPVDVLHDGKVDDLNTRPSMIWFTDGTEGQVAAAKAAMKPIAEPYFEKNRDNNSSMCFMYAVDNGMAKNIKELLKISTIPSLVVVNISSDEGPRKAIYNGEKDLNEDVIQEFFKGFEENTLQYEIMQ